jgi:hypothetical protein|tara:strand:- start:110 stop:595 length:486 start_codon:yes stop_codon:yes gene_type:complete
MALKLIRHVGTITASTLGDDAAHGLALGKLGNGNAFRVNEFGGNDVFIKVTSIDQRTAVTSSNGLYLRANNTVNIVPEGDRSPIVGGDTGARVALDGTDSDQSDAGSLIHLDGTDADGLNAGSGVLINAAEENYFISVINETGSGSDGAVHIEVVTQANPV